MEKKSKNQGKCYYLGSFEFSNEDEILETYLSHSIVLIKEY